MNARSVKGGILRLGCRSCLTSPQELCGQQPRVFSLNMSFGLGVGSHFQFNGWAVSLMGQSERWILDHFGSDVLSGATL